MHNTHSMNPASDPAGMDQLEREIASASLIQHDHIATDPLEDSGLQALVRVAKYFDIALDARQTWYSHGKTEGLFSHIDIIRCAKRAGLKARLVTLNPAKLTQAPVPFIISSQLTGQRYRRAKPVWRTCRNTRPDDRAGKPALAGAASGSFQRRRLCK